METYENLSSFSADTRRAVANVLVNECERGTCKLPLGGLAGSVMFGHYANMSMQYTAIFHGCKNDNFQMKILIFFLFLLKT